PPITRMHADKAKADAVLKCVVSRGFQQTDAWPGGSASRQPKGRINLVIPALPLHENHWMTRFARPAGRPAAVLRASRLSRFRGDGACECEAIRLKRRHPRSSAFIRVIRGEKRLMQT